MERYICIHGHFYQPPRENPWLEAVELQDSAYPFHDWNERVTAECYAPNGASRILDAEGHIKQIVNNYASISFDLGPTLLSWMQSAAPDVYQSILDADKESIRQFSGHGSAMAQAYNHMIMPLATNRDKRTQVLWGIRDFEHRFGRKPEGMWLPETAVDLESLDLLAEQGILFTVLAPRQASQIRRRQRDGHWEDVSGGRVEPRRPYMVRLPSGRSIAVFFYEGAVSQAVAFEHLLNRGETFADRLLGAFHGGAEDANLVHIATDGETYGHHHRFGDMALAYASHHIASNGLATIINYPAFLAKFPPTYEAQIFENTSWSCVHGVERWRANCGCNSGGHGGWDQEWRAPLRTALDWLRDRLASLYETFGPALLSDPWAARDGYIDLILDRSPEATDTFFGKYAVRDLSPEERTRALKLLEIQRHAMLMYTSCGWFFDELSGIETVQVIHYAGRTIQLAQEIAEDHLEEEFLNHLEKAKSNISEHKDGRDIYEKFVKPAVVGWERVAAHYAVTSLFRDVPQRGHIYSYRVEADDFKTITAGRARLLLGKIQVASILTHESAYLAFCVLYLGGHTVNGSVCRVSAMDDYQSAADEVSDAFNQGDFPDVIRLMDRYFGQATYSLSSLFRDEQRMALDQILDVSLEDAEEAYRHIYEGQAPLLRFLINMGMPLPRPLHMAAELFLNAALRRACNALPLQTERIRNLVAEAKFVNIDLDNEGLGYRLTLTLRRLMEEFVQDADNPERLDTLLDAVTLTHEVPFHVNLWKLQNVYYGMISKQFKHALEQAEAGDTAAQEWATKFRQLGKELMIRVD